VLLVLGVKEPEATAAPVRNPLALRNLSRLGTAYWGVVAVGALFALARFSEAFLVLRAQQSGVALSLVPLVMVAMNVSYSLSAYPFGQLSDRMSHARLLRMGVVVLIAADLVLASSAHWSALLAGVLLWGLHMGMTQGLLASMVAATAPVDLRGTAYGFFNLMSGLAVLVASVVAGALWDRFGAPVTFCSGAGFCALAWLASVWAPRLRAA
jgi:MFS family permease